MSTPNFLNMKAVQDVLRATPNPRDFFAELFGVYRADSRERLRSIHQSIQLKNADELMRTAHALKSGSAAMGVDRLAELCQHIEDIEPGSIDWLVMQIIADEMQSYFEGACAQLQGIFEGLQA